MRPLSKKESYDHRIPTTKTRIPRFVISAFGTIAYSQMASAIVCEDLFVPKCGLRAASPRFARTIIDVVAAIAADDEGNIIGLPLHVNGAGIRHTGPAASLT
jgi:hypothetical protein